MRGRGGGDEEGIDREGAEKMQFEGVVTGLNCSEISEVRCWMGIWPIHYVEERLKTSLTRGAGQEQTRNRRTIENI